MSSTNETPSSSVWTPANRGKSFDAAASAAFGTKRQQQKPDAGRAEFSGLAASAFNNKRKGEKTDKSEPVKEEPVTQSRFASALAALPSVPAVSSAPESHSAPMSHAFGKQRATESSRFNETATAAFGKKQTPQESNETSLFDGVAASAFGKKRQDGGDNLFGDQAASVFGKKRQDRRGHENSNTPTIVIEKKNTLWASISGLMPEAKEPERQWAGSAIRQQKKKAEEEAVAAIAAKKQSASIEVTDTDFPSLGFTPKPVSKPVSKSSSGNSFSALADDFPALESKPVSKSSSSISFAEIMRKRVEQEEAEAKAEADRRAQEESRRQRALMERLSNPLIRIRHNVGNSGNYYEEDDFNPDYNDEDDLDYVHPSEMAKRVPASSYYDNDEDEYGPIDDEEEEQDNSAW